MVSHCQLERLAQLALRFRDARRIHSERTRISDNIKVWAFSAVIGTIGFKFPLLAKQPGVPPRLNTGEIGEHEFLAFVRDQHAADATGEDFHRVHAGVQHADQPEIARPRGHDGEPRVVNHRTEEIVDLNDEGAPPAGGRRMVLQHAAQAPVFADGLAHGLELRDRLHVHRAVDLQHRRDVFWQVRQERLAHALGLQVLQLREAVLPDPVGERAGAAGRDARDLDARGLKGGLVLFDQVLEVGDGFKIDPYASVINSLIEMVHTKFFR